MIVDKDTLYSDFACFEERITDGEREALKASAVRSVFGDDGFYSLTIGQLLDCAGGRLGCLFTHGGISVFDMYIQMAFADWLGGEFSTLLEALTLKPTAKEQTYSRGCKSVTFEEGVLLFCRRYFGLHGFKEAEALRVSDYVIAKKDDYNRSLIERNQMNNIK